METLRYELPPNGISLLGYIVRRMHKTEWLAKIPALLKEGKTAQALEAASIYAAASSTSFGKAFYQPRFNSVGEIIQEPDPLTHALVTAKLESSSPHYHITYSAKMKNGDTFSGSEKILGTTIGLRGLGMPAPSKFQFNCSEPDYSAEFTGTLTSELALSLFGNTKIRAYGSLDLKDSAGNTGRLKLNREGVASIRINAQPVIHHKLERIIQIEKLDSQKASA